MVFIDDAGDEPDRLEKPFGSGWLEPGPRELSGNILGCLTVPLAAGVAAFELVIGQRHDVGPPALSVGCMGGSCVECKSHHDHGNGC